MPVRVSIIEKHVTLNRKGGPDDSFSEFNELCELCNGAKIA